MKLKRRMYEEGEDFYLGNGKQENSSKAEKLERWIIVLEFITLVVVLATLVFLGQYICDRFRRVAVSQTY